MTSQTITDAKGRVFEWTSCKGHGFFEPISARLIPGGWEAKVQEVKTLELRPDDVMICTYVKAGSHWIWEIVSMVLKGTAEYETNTKEALMLEFQSSDTLSAFPSPRILNCHFTPSCLPDQIKTKKPKIIHLMRNPKDITASLYHHMKALMWMFDDETPFETFSEFLPYVTGEYGVYIHTSLWEYYHQFEKFTKDNPDLILTLSYEKMKLTPTDAVRRIAEFLEKELPADVIQSIAERCSFSKLKNAHDTLKKRPANLIRLQTEEEKTKPHPPPVMYRKGEVGDWKNHFTVAENEQFDKRLEREFGDTDIKFIYSL